MTLGGRQNGAARPLPDLASQRGGGAAIGRIIGPSFAREQVAHVVERLVRTYLTLRDSDQERFIDVVERVGIDPFKHDVYADPQLAKAAPRAQAVPA
ncbi:sulfite reductase [Bordetella trematum]|nr:sulfite reductase [Bordetella trematum]